MEIIGIPVIVSACYRIVLNNNIRSLFGISPDDTLKIKQSKNLLCVNRFSGDKRDDTWIKYTTVGRFNLPSAWVRANNIEVGDYVYLTATKFGILISPQKINFSEREGFNGFIWGYPAPISYCNFVYIPKTYCKEYALKKGKILRTDFNDKFIFKRFTGDPVNDNESVVAFSKSSVHIPMQWTKRNKLISGKDFLYIIGIDDTLVISAKRDIEI